MLAVVIPAHNEAGSISKVIYNTHVLRPDMIVPVLNGCTDNSLDEILKLKKTNLQVLHFPQSLGVDVPRALGAIYAFNHGASRVIFIDGDMVGSYQQHLLNLDAKLISGVHMALTNCYPHITARQPLTSHVLRFRARLNIDLGKYSDLGLATPSHGPHGISKELFSAVPASEFAVPPVSLVIAVKRGLKVSVATAVPHAQLGSPARGSRHSDMMAATLIGDSIEGLHVLNKAPRSRKWGDEEYIGYHNRRRFDIIEQYQNSGARWNVFRRNR